MAGRIAKGISWSAIQQFSTQIIQFVVTIILARLLTPAQFGVVAASTIVIAILQVINESGFGTALMQKLDRDETDFNSVFILNLAMGIVLYVIVVLSSHLLAVIFKTPELETVIKWLGLNLIIGSFMVVQQTKLFINVDFKTWTKASVTAYLIGGSIGIYMAYNNFGVYALVAQSLISNFLNVLLIWIMVKWVPTFQFSLKRIKSLFQFAYKLIAARLVNTVFNQLYSSVIAVAYNPADLALFNRARTFETLSSTNIVLTVQRVSIPLMCEHQNFQEELRAITLKFIHRTAFVITPLLVLLFTLAKPLILVLLTEKWIESAYMLKIICFAGFFYSISAFNMNLFNAVGKTGRAFKCEVTKKIISVLIIAGAVISGNFDLLIWSFLICAFVECIIDVSFAGPIIKAGFFSQLKGMYGILGISFLMGLFVYFGCQLISNIYIQLFGLGISGILLYIALSYILNIGPVREFLKFNKN